MLTELPKLEWPEINLMIAFGILLAFGTLGGMLAARMRWLPTITGFMVFGLLIGPSGLSLMPVTSLDKARPLVEIALGLILFKLGATLHPMAVLRNRRLLITSLVESLATFAAILGLLLWIGVGPLVALLAASISVSSSPAVLIHVAEELHASGPTVSTAQALVALNNVLAFVLYSLCLPLALHDKFELSEALMLPAYQLMGAVVISMTVAWLVTRIALYTRHDEEHFRFALVVGGVMLAIGLALSLKASTLFTSLTLGVACRWLQGRSKLSRVDFGGGGDVFFIILFVFAGANLHLHDLLQYGSIAAAYVAVRTLAKCLSIYVCGRRFGVPHRQALSQGLLLVPMAGLAIGLVQNISGLMPELGAKVAAVVLASVAVFETIGPPLAAFALRFVGEAGAANPDREPAEEFAVHAGPAADSAVDSAIPGEASDTGAGPGLVGSRS
ncbi:cation:proton antiporter [uncultured Sphaerotilus sp.]|uniref:cation:proton antiporter n=1 Tax=uncultured Sphaerotilus sp. TaxID=474984 RepID=UPI0030CA16BA